MRLKILLSAFFFISVLFANGQILYTDFVPDTTIATPPFDSTYVINIDINQDGISDFGFSSYRWYQFATPSCCDCSKQSIFPLDTNSKVGWVDTLYSNGPCRHATIDNGVVIDNSTLYWRGSTLLKYNCSSQFISCSQAKFFVPIKLFLGGNYFFGWIRLAGTTIYDMAINLTPNQPITAAQITTGINDVNEISKVAVYPNPFREELNIIISNNERSEIILYDISSKKLFQQKFTSSITLNTTELEKGIYLYEIMNKSGFLKQGKIIKY